MYLLYIIIKKLYRLLSFTNLSLFIEFIVMYLLYIIIEIKKLYRL